MGGVVLLRAELNGTLSEVVGYKAGLALSEQDMASHVDEEFSELILGDPDEVVRVRSEEAEELVSQLLYGLGNTTVRHRVMPGMEVYRRLARLPNGSELYHQFQLILLAEFETQQIGTTPFDFTPVLERASAELGEVGSAMALLYYDMTQVGLQQNPWTKIRRTDWKDIAKLRELFESESLETSHGEFIDQRFIDYLERNFEKIDRINWRKFEGLTCEFFDRAGFHIEIAEGRNDGGIDARVWPDAQSKERPPTILVQCKRQKHKVEKVVVKALWADVVAEQATSGLIVTTSSLSPGAAKVCEARAYPVDEADRATVKRWLTLMRTPNTGVFLGL
jgi:restriction system protein